MKKFKIPSIPPTTNKCIRFPNDIIENVVEAVKVALENLEETE